MLLCVNAYKQKALMNIKLTNFIFNALKISKHKKKNSLTQACIYMDTHTHTHTPHAHTHTHMCCWITLLMLI